MSATATNTVTIAATTHVVVTLLNMSTVAPEAADMAAALECVVGRSTGRKHQPALAIMATPSTTLCDSERIRCVRFSRAICRPKDTMISTISSPPTPAIHASSMEKLLPPSRPAGKITLPSITVVAQIADSRPAIAAITWPATPSRNGLNTTSSTTIASEAMIVNGTAAGLAASPYIMPGTNASATSTAYAMI